MKKNTVVSPTVSELLTIESKRFSIITMLTKAQDLSNDTVICDSFVRHMSTHIFQLHTCTHILQCFKRIILDGRFSVELLCRMESCLDKWSLYNCLQALITLIELVLFHKMHRKIGENEEIEENYKQF